MKYTLLRPLLDQLKQLSSCKFRDDLIRNSNLEEVGWRRNMWSPVCGGVSEVSNSERPESYERVDLSLRSYASGWFKKR